MSVLTTGVPSAGAAGLSGRSIRRSVVKIYVTIQRADYTMPWQSEHPMSGTGSGFLIGGKRILTNAHVVSDARDIQVQKDGNSRLYPARVKAVAHDCDLAILDVDDPGFYDNTESLSIAETLPDLNSEVTVFGYPLGGIRLSITQGVVSRIDYSVYAHSAVDQHLVLQVDAAINPGNSGGPVVYQNKVIGVAFQGLDWAENIGYVIPVPVVRRFLEDLEDGRYDGYPELGVACFDNRNEGLVLALGLPETMTGAVVYYVDPFGNASGLLLPSDVILSIDGFAISDDGNVELRGNTVDFQEIVEQKQAGTTVLFDVWRGRRKMQVTVPLSVPSDPFIFRNSYDELPRYVIHGGLVFTTLSRGYLIALGRNLTERNAHQLLYYSRYAKIDNLYRQHDEFVILSGVLPHPVNMFCNGFQNGIVTQANNKAVRNLDDLQKALQNPVEGYHLVRFAGLQDMLVMPARAAADANQEIGAAYGIDRAEEGGRR